MSKMYQKSFVSALCICAMVLWLGACGSGESSSTASSVDGKAVYTKHCVLCHGDDGRREVNGAKDITVSPMTLKERVALIKTGKNLMAPFEGVLSPEEMEAAAQYSMTLK